MILFLLAVIIGVTTVKSKEAYPLTSLLITHQCASKQEPHQWPLGILPWVLIHGIKFVVRLLCT